VAVIRSWDSRKICSISREARLGARLGADTVQVGLTPVGYELLRHR